jgi:hypothetical protein
MGKYDQRIIELRKQLELVTKGEKNQVSKRLDEMITQWAVKREVLLDDLVLISKWKPSDPMKKRWDDRVKLGRTELADQFAEGVKELMLPPPVQLWWQQALKLEDECISMPILGLVPRRAEELGFAQMTRANLILELMEKWTWLLSAKASFQAPELQAVAEMDRLIQEVISTYDKTIDRTLVKVGELRSKAAAFAEKTRETIKKSKLGGAAEWVKAVGVEVLKIAADIPDELSAAAPQTVQALDITHGVAQANALAAQAQIATYRNLLALERGGPLRMFKTNRDQVEQYLRTSASTQALYDDAVSALAIWASGCSTDGLRADAVTFVNLLTVNLKALHQVNTQSEALFKEKFEGVFYGGLKADTLEQLAQQYLFGQKIAQLKARGAPRKLQEVAGQLPGAVEAQIESAFDPMLKFDSDTPAEVRELLTLKNKEFRAHVRQHLEPKIKSLLNVTSHLQELFGESRIAQDWERQQLIDELK